MSDKKLTDKEIIKALGCLIHDNCEDCQYYRDDCTERIKDPRELSDYALGLIIRQQGEIERLQNTLDDVLDRQPKLVANAEKYIVEEFAERLKNKIKTECNPYGKPTFDYDTSLAIMRYIDNLVKEMVGETDD